MYSETMEKDLKEMEQRYSDGHIQSYPFWEIFFVECCLLVLKHGECKEINDGILALYEKLEKKMTIPLKRKSPYER